MSRERHLGKARRSGQTRAASKREREQRARRKERLIVGGAAGVLVAAAAIVLVGLYITQYRPPRAHVLTVGDRDYNASQIARRAVYELFFGGGVTPDYTVVVPETLQVIEDEAAVLASAPAVVGEVTDEDIDAELRDRLGFTDSEDDEGYAEALATLLRASDLPRREYNEIVAEQILLKRLGEGFREEIGNEAAQVRVSRIRLTDRGGAEDVRALLLDGAGFTELAKERTAEANRADSGGDLGWQPPSLLSDAAQSAISELGPGQISEVVEDGSFFDVYLVVARQESRALESDQIDALVATRQSEWIVEHRGSVESTSDLSDGEERWIVERVRNNVTARLPPQ